MCVYLPGGGPVSSGPDGEILHREENHQKQEEDGESNESPEGTSTESVTEEALLHQ